MNTLSKPLGLCGKFGSDFTRLASFSFGVLLATCSAAGADDRHNPREAQPDRSLELLIREFEEISEDWQDPAYENREALKSQTLKDFSNLSDEIAEVEAALSQLPRDKQNELESVISDLNRLHSNLKGDLKIIDKMDYTEWRILNQTVKERLNDMLASFTDAKSGIPANTA